MDVALIRNKLWKLTHDLRMTLCLFVVVKCFCHLADIPLMHNKSIHFWYKINYDFSFSQDFRIVQSSAIFHCFVQASMHMWQMRHRNPSELLQTCPCIFLNCFSITNNIWARKFFSIYGLLQKWFTSVFPYVIAKYRENWHFLGWELPEIA